MKDILKHPTVSAIVGTVVGTAIVTPIVAYINKVDHIEALKLIYNWLKKFITSLLTYQVSLWIILLALFMYIGVKRVAPKFNVNNNNIKQSITVLYRKDIIDNILWIFEWYEGYDGKIALTNDSPHPICPNCMNDLVVSNKSSDGYFSPYPNSFVCDNCGFSQKIGNRDYQEKIRREIIRRVRTGEWRKSLSEESFS